MTRPLHGPLNPTPVDHATDTYDTIDWLVKNVPESNGKVGILGISYDGFTTLMAMFNPHPALKVVVPMNPMVDGWMGDDWFHNGAFREQMKSYFQEQEAARGKGPEVVDTHTPTTTTPTWRRVRRARWAVCTDWSRPAFWRKMLAHPSYDEFWQDQAVDKLLAAQPLKVPVLLVRQSLGPGRHLRRDRRCTAQSSPRTRRTTWSSWCWGRGITGRRIARAAAWAHSSFPPIRRWNSASRSSRRFWRSI